MLVKDLIDKIPLHTRDRVAEAQRRYLPAVRECLRQETRLLTRWEPQDGAQGFSWQCPVSVDKIGIPTILRTAEIPSGFELAALLAIWQPTLKALSESGTEFREMICQLDEELSSEIELPETEYRLSDVLKAVSRLLRLLKSKEQDFDLVTSILAVNADVLGVYRFRDVGEPPSRATGFDAGNSIGDNPFGYAKQYRAEISLYWGVIGLIAQALSLSIEGLTVAVMAHELGHAYTHLGFDRDGRRWTAIDFENSEHALVEGLAQYYTARVVDRLERRIPEAKHAYSALLPKQPAAYQSHLAWLDSATPELVGAALSRIRRNGGAQHEDFESVMEGIHLAG